MKGPKKTSPALGRGAKALALLLALAAPSWASFEDLEVGPRATAMGGAFVAQTDDALGLFYNPASLGGMRRWHGSFIQDQMYTGLTDGSQLGRQIIALAGPLRRGRWGHIGLSRYSFGLTGLYEETATKIAYGRRAGERFRWGLGISQLAVAYPGSEDASVAGGASAMGFDFGVQYDRKYTRWALSMLNLNQPDVGAKYANPVDRKILLGLMLKKDQWNGNFVLGKVGEDIRFKTGMETWFFKQRAAVRGGFNLGSRDYRNFSFGFGYRTKYFHVDLSILMPLSGISGVMSQQFGVGFRWGKEVEDKPGAEKPEGEAGDLDPAMQNAFDELAQKLGDHLEEKLSRVMAQQELMAMEAGLKAPTATTSAALKEERSLLNKVRRFLNQGSFGLALVTLQKAPKHLLTRLEIQELTAKLEPIVGVFGIRTLSGQDQRSYLIRLGLLSYLKDDGKTAVDALTHANEKWRGDVPIAKLLDYISEKMPGYRLEHRVGGISLIQMKLQEALELMYDRKYLVVILRCQEVLMLEPGNLLAMKRMGSAYWALEYKDVAKVLWRKALKQHPEDKELLKYLRQSTKSTAPETKATPEEYQRAMEFYYKLKKSGGSKDVLKGASKRILERFKGTGIDIRAIEKEYGRLNK